MNVITRLHYRVVRNAYFGPETWWEWDNHPAIIEVSRPMSGEMPWYYRHVRFIPVLYADEYARIDVAVPIIVGHRANEAWWRFLSWLGRRGVIHSSVPNSCMTRFRDLRWGP